MTGWVDKDIEGFFRAFDSYWPGRLRLTDPRDELLRTWRDVAQKFDVAIAMGSLRDLFEGQEKPTAPTPAAFRSVAVPMQRFVNERKRLVGEERATGERLYTGVEIAADDALWEELLQKAADENDRGRYDWLVRCRQRLAKGGEVLK